MRSRSALTARVARAGLVLLVALGLVSALRVVLPARVAGQGVTAQNRERARRMLEQIRKDLVDHYYDSTFGGLNLEARYRHADSAIQAAPDMNRLMGAIAQFVSELQDSHTRFYPPTRVARVDYGFDMQFIGDTCFVVRVDKGSDAEKKGLRVGDAVLAVDSFKPERNTFWILEYIYYSLSPRPGVRLAVRAPEGAPRTLDVVAKVTEGERIIDLSNPSTVRRILDEYEEAARRVNHIWRSLGDSVLVWRMRGFWVDDEEAIKEMVGRAKKHRAVILDLRNNPGGSVKTELFFLGQFFNRDVEVLKVRQRSRTEPRVAKAAKDPYLGMLIILVNSGSASASEITARLMQLEARAIIVGDRTAGAVVTSMFYPHEVGFGRVFTYGASISVADVIMPDGQRLERVGVTPDHVVLPTGADLATRRDPQMAKALELVGVTVTPEEAGAIFRPRPE